MSFATKTLSASILLALAGTAAAASSNASDRAQQIIAAHAQGLKASAYDAFSVKGSFIGPDGTEHVRVERTYRGLRVLDGDAVIHNGRNDGVSQTLRGKLDLDTKPALSQDDAIVAAGALFGSDFVGAPTAELVITSRNSSSPRLAYLVSMSNDSQDKSYLVAADSTSAKVLDVVDNRHSGKPGGGTSGGGTPAVGTGKSIYSGNVTLNTSVSGGVYNLTDQTRGGGYTTDMANGTRGSGTLFTDADNIWGNNTNSDRASAAADAHFGIATTWDYYKNVHGRNGIANDGKGALSKVHYSRNYVNAFWSDSCFCMSFGDGDGVTYGPLVDLDVAGHEMSHGVTSRSANLTYSGESGGLNEATSDIFGTMVEFYANNASDTPDYLIGEEIYISNPGNAKALRYMFRPNKDGASSDCWYSGVGSLDVHYSSGPANHFFYLLAEGTGAKTYSGVDHTPSVCKAGDTKAGTGSASLAGIGRDKAEKIWYLALTGYMTSSTNYAGARVATLNAARDLYGSGSAEYNAVAAAWTAINVN